MESFGFAYISEGAEHQKVVKTSFAEPVSVQQVIERFFAFLEETGIDSETLIDAAGDVLMERTLDGMPEPDEQYELELVDPGYDLGVGLARSARSTAS